MEWSYIEFGLDVLAQQITDVFIVDFQDADLHLKAPVSLALLDNLHRYEQHVKSTPLASDRR
jgi:hypothetical protein